jgi:hypothetical protein
MPALVKALNKVDFPTLGRPTMPHFKLMTVPENQGGKCMRCVACGRGPGVRVLRAAGGLALVLGMARWPQRRHPAPSTVRSTTRPARSSRRTARPALAGCRGTATIDQVARGAMARFQPHARRADLHQGTQVHCGCTSALERPAGQQAPLAAWSFRSRAGPGHGVPAGRARAMAGADPPATRWPSAAGPRPAATRRFASNLPSGQARDVYVRLRHVTPISLPVRL